MTTSEADLYFLMALSMKVFFGTNEMFYLMRNNLYFIIK